MKPDHVLDEPVCLPPQQNVMLTALEPQWESGVEPDMWKKPLGPSAAGLAEVGLGTYLYRGGPALLRRGIDLGAAFIDTAELYGNEEVVGQAVRGIRDRVFIATKTHHFRYDQVLRCAEASLKRLGVDTIDLYQLHHPQAAVPIDETMAAMERLVEQGKVRFLGVSNFTRPEFLRAQAALKANRIVSNQMRYSLVDRTIEGELLPFSQQQEVTLIAYSPLGHAFRSILEADGNGVLREVAQEAGKTRAQVALNWCLAKPGVVVIPKTESEEHLVENCASSGWRLHPEQVTRLDRGIRFRRRGPFEVALRRFVRRGLQRLRRR